MNNVDVTEVHCYHAMWCHSCPKVRMAFMELKREFESTSMSFIDVDVESDDGVDLSIKYQVRNVPTILVVKSGRVIERIVGTKSKEQIKEVLNKWK